MGLDLLGRVYIDSAWVWRRPFGVGESRKEVGISQESKAKSSPLPGSRVWESDVSWFIFLLFYFLLYF